INMLEVASSATLPSISHMTALTNPRDRASKIARALFGYRHPALASTGMLSRVGRRNDESVTENPVGWRIGASKITRHHRVDSGSGRSEEHTSELQSRQYLVCRLLLEKKKT